LGNEPVVHRHPKQILLPTKRPQLPNHQFRFKVLEASRKVFPMEKDFHGKNGKMAVVELEDVLLFRFTLFWERSILIIKEARARRIKIIEEVEAGGVVRTGNGPVTP
jgi:hypothetical protein